MLGETFTFWMSAAPSVCCTFPALQRKEGGQDYIPEKFFVLQ